MTATGYGASLVGSAALASLLIACGCAPPGETLPTPGPEAVAGRRMVDLSHAYGVCWHGKTSMAVCRTERPC